MNTPTLPPPTEQLTTLLTTFGLTAAAREIVPRLTQAERHEVIPLLVEIFDIEAEERRQRRIARRRQAARLPPGKTFETLDDGRLPLPIVQHLQQLATGAFLETATNVLAFGLPGVGKSHALCAVGHALVEAGHHVLFTPAYALVQELLSAKRELELPRALRKLDLFEVILVDDLGHVQQSAEEAEVLFTLLAERYERRSVMVTSNLVFSEWDRIFKDKMATAAAIDRLVHHAVILEFDGPSFRTDRSRGTTGSPAPPSSRRNRPPGPLVPRRRR
jgi:DNA replication protein DnaC